jgi:MFS family permease
MTRGYIYWVACFSAIGGFLFGYDTGIMSSVVEIEEFTNLFNVTDWTKGLIVSVFQLGAFVGALLVSFAADFKGRRMAIALGSIVFIIGAVFQTAAPRVGVLYAGRVISGIAIGVLSMVIPLYQSELAPKDIRGRLISLQ